MSCILRISGLNFPAAEFLASTSLLPDKIWHKGEVAVSGTERKHLDSGFNIIICEESGHNLELQIAEATLFLREQHAELDRLRKFKGVEHITIDFGLEWPGSVAHFDHLPASFVSLVGQLGIGLELSHYSQTE